MSGADAPLLRQLERLVADLERRATEIFGSVGSGMRGTALARMIASACTSPVWEDAQHGCKLAANLLDRYTLESDSFWRTPLGRLMAWHIGYPADRVRVSMVGPILGTSRAYAYRVTASLDKETRDHHATVATADVLRLVRNRRPSPST